MLILYIITALIVGINISSWGSIKDSPYEGYKFSKVIKTILKSLILGTIIYTLLPEKNLLTFFGLTYISCVFFNEYTKTFLRIEDQSKYTIPMTFHINGKIVTKPLLKYTVAVVYLLIVMTVGVILYKVGDLNKEQIPLWLYLLLSSVGGWMSAFGGGWKDGPIEGFSIKKFFRSPLVAMSWGIILRPFINTYLELAIATLGYTVMSIEFYKSVLSKKTPGKFDGKPILYSKSLSNRKYILIPYILSKAYIMVLILSYYLHIIY